MTVRLCRWGNSTGLRIPKVVLEAAGLKPGRAVALRLLDNGDIRMRPVGPSQPADAASAASEDAAPDSPTVW
ncbi:MAG: AbrB/MazE/SpoVT family DNA-binding domain-containing protein [Burkholderiales bacterium]|nr:AbrB/MazE/SpoVT family DNA-binding domain-containing protein [Burkholderiales bacterium]